MRKCICSYKTGVVALVMAVTILVSFFCSVQNTYAASKIQPIRPGKISAVRYCNYKELKQIVKSSRNDNEFVMNLLKQTKKKYPILNPVRPAPKYSWTFILENKPPMKNATIKNWRSLPNILKKSGMKYMRFTIKAEANPYKKYTYTIKGTVKCKPVNSKPVNYR